ncbi:protein suppressor of white apricot isoform X2 [Macrosteles quadrilineatus]|uniref:protein suppressor of white apricot isoform X2 n=1 Tax=Macrosteles quadrilineatus TaxID=74068 RepID=UPI0023E0CECF|nr:protein suppressor of white apricot isoform X2 [Macrosteles quadrilineatus]
MSKDKRWIIQNDPGILRKKADAETDLLVFGYACKVFRDDEKALEMDQGKHLIPWMGDETLKIDRYDARGHLSEVSQFEATNQDYVLTAEERRIEQICDEERYRALHHNEEEQEMYQEEELKRLKQALSSDKEYGQVAYQYENDKPPPTNTEPDSNTEEEEPFTPNPTLFIPADMTLPSTVKENQIIEKTAAHIASHGSQVEILIKTRQANNQKLNFLHVGSPLNPYYNFILGQIKIGRYKPAFMTQQEDESALENDEHYLHPSLAPSSTTVESAPSIPSIAYKPSSDCSYNLLVNKIRNMQQSLADSMGEKEEPSTSGDSPTFRRRRRSKRHSIQAQPTTSVQKQVSVPPQHVKEIVSRLINFAYSRDLHPSEIASDLMKQDPKNFLFVEPGHKYHDYYVQQLRETYKENIYNLSNPSMETVENEEQNGFNLGNAYGPERPSEEDLNHLVLSKNPPSFQESTDGVSSVVDEDSSAPYSQYDVPSQPNSKPAPVCFSIKKPKETERLGHASAFPLEESSSGEDGVEEGEIVPTPQDSRKERCSEGENSTVASDERPKTPTKSSKEKEHLLKHCKQSPGSASSVEVVIISPQTSDNSRRTDATPDGSSHVSPGTTLSSGRKSVKTPNKTKTSSSKKRTRSTDRSRKSTTPNGSRLSSRKLLSSGDSSRKSRERKHHPKYKAKSTSFPDKYKDNREREKLKALNDRSDVNSLLRIREKMKAMEEKGGGNADSVTKVRNDSDDLPPLPEDSLLNSHSGVEVNLEKKREERKKKVKEMIQKIKTESLGSHENSQVLLQGESGLTSSTNGSPSFSKSFLSQVKTSVLNKNNKTEPSKGDSQKDIEEQLREQVKQSLKKIAETTLAAIPPVTEDSCSQFDHSSAANSNGFESPTSCGRPIYRVSQTPTVGLMDFSFQDSSRSRSSSTVISLRSHKKKKHHKKKKKKRKGRSKSKKHHESSSDSSSEDESTDDWESSSDSDAQPKKRHKKSGKRSHKKHKRKHRKRQSSSSSSTD